jgi:hypothetical protein
MYPCAYLIKHHIIKTYGGGRIAPPFLTSALDGVECSSRPVRFTPRERAPGTTLDIKLGVTQSRSGRCGVEKYSLPLTGIEPRPSSQ